MTPAAEQEAICTYLDWDSKFFQLPIARLNRTRLDHSTVTHALQWCNTNRIECLYFLCDSDDPQTTYLAEANGFHLTDVRVVFEQALAQSKEFAAPSGAIRLARESDLGLLRTLASAAHHDTRFYFDQNFDRAKVRSAVRNLDRKQLPGLCPGRAGCRSRPSARRLPDLPLKAERISGRPGRRRCKLPGKGFGHDPGSKLPRVVPPPGRAAGNGCHPRQKPCRTASLPAKRLRHRIRPVVVSPLVSALIATTMA